MADSRERDRFVVGLIVLGIYGLALAAPLLSRFTTIDAQVLQILSEARGQIRDFAFLVITYYFATSKGSSDKTRLLTQAPPPP